MIRFLYREYNLIFLFLFLCTRNFSSSHWRAKEDKSFLDASEYIKKRPGGYLILTPVSSFLVSYLGIVEHVRRKIKKKSKEKRKKKKISKGENLRGKKIARILVTWHIYASCELNKESTRDMDKLGSALRHTTERLFMYMYKCANGHV